MVDATHTLPNAHSSVATERTKHADVRFWSCFALLNALLFLPFFIINLNDVHFGLAPLKSFSDLRHTLVALIFWRENADPFRLNTEWLWLTVLWVNVAWLRRNLYRWLMLAVYFIALFYYSYESIMLYLYKDEPIFYNHYFLVRDGLKFLLDHMHLSLWLYLAAALFGVGLIGGIIWLVLTLVDAPISGDLSRGSHIMLVALAGASLLSLAGYRNAAADPRMVISSLTAKLEQNIEASVNLYQSVAQFDDSTLRSAYDYRRQYLLRKPNIYLIFVESYGSVLYKRPDYKIAYLEMLDEMETALEENGLHMASALTESPTWGGGSWLAYTSALYGLRMEAHPQYLAFLEKYQDEGERYPNFGDYLRQQGYYFAWLTSIASELKEEKRQMYQRFYGVDRWIQYRDLAYKGVHYGWGPAPPDQYVLNATRESLLAETNKPLVLFFITQNSHYPWQPLPEMVDDWRTLNQPSPAGEPEPIEALSHADTRQHYLDSVDYTLDMLTEFILNGSNENGSNESVDEDAIYVLVGDHQPPRVSRRDDGYETPIHIVSRDAKLLDNLAAYGFEPGAAVTAAEPQLHHEGLYSLFVRLLVETYGVRPEAAPEYLPQGVLPPHWAAAPTATPTGTTAETSAATPETAPTPTLLPTPGARATPVPTVESEK